MKSGKSLSLLILICAMILCNSVHLLAQEKGQTEKVKTEIEDSYAGFVKHLNNGDAAAVANNYYTEDSKFYPPGQDVATGKNQIQQAFQGIIDSGVKLQIDVQEVEVFGNVAYEYGKATFLDGEGNTVGSNDYVVLWKRDGNSWKIYRDFVR